MDKACSVVGLRSMVLVDSEAVLVRCSGRAARYGVGRHCIMCGYRCVVMLRDMCR